MKKYLLLLLVVLACIGGVYLSYRHFNKPLKTTEIKDSPFSILMQNATDTFAESTDWYDVKIDYTKNNQKISDLIFQKYQDFQKDTGIKNYTNLKDAKEGLQLNVEGMKYNFYATYKLATSSNSISYVYEIYTYTGGAHGGTAVYPITLDDTLQIIPVEKILPDASLQKVSALCRANIIKQKRERMKSYGSMTDKEIDEALKDDTFIDEGVKPTRDNYSNVWIDGDSVVVSFGQYQVGAYAEGMFEVKIPKSEI